MLPYFKRYSIYVCIIAVALPVIYSTIYPMVTGQMPAASIYGLIVMVLLFIFGLMVGFGIFERKAQQKADAMVALYNDDCDPQAFLKEGEAVAKNMTSPYNQVISWFLSYFAQAKLEMGDIEDAKAICAEMKNSIEVAKKPFEKLGIIVNAIPLVQKVEGDQSALELCSKGLEICDLSRAADVAQYRDFIDSQAKIMHMRLQGDSEELAKLDDSIWQSSAYPKRIRVEYAWDAASADYKAGNIARERDALEYVVRNGGELAFVSKAKSRLTSL